MSSNSSCKSWASLMLRVGLAVTCFSQISEPLLAASSAPSEQLLSLASMLSATFSNEAEVRQEIANGQPALELVSGFYKPISVPGALDSAVTFYYQIIFNGNQTTNYVVGFNEDDQGLIVLKYHKLIGSPPNDPQTLTEDDIDYAESCDATFYNIDDGIFFGEVPDCFSETTEGHRSFPNVITCDVLGFLVPTGNNGKASHVPYQMRPTTRYPLPPSFYAGVDNYENPCL